MDIGKLVDAVVNIVIMLAGAVGSLMRVSQPAVRGERALLRARRRCRRRHAKGEEGDGEHFW
jgi:hypothetical protein